MQGTNLAEKTVDVGRPAGDRTVLLLMGGACLASLTLYAYALYSPALIVDDFQLLSQSWTWADAWHNLWLPTNEHAMPLGRLTIWLMGHLAGRATNLPLVMVLQGPLAVLAGMVLVHLFVRRELGHPLYGVVAASLFGVTTVYHQAVFWFSASFSILSLDMTLLALLAAQGWRRSGRPGYLLWSALWAALAPGWFAIGILAGPLTALYLLPPEQPGWDFPAPPRGRLHFPLLRLLLALTPLLGSAAFLAVSLPRTAKHIMHLQHYDGKTAVEAFNPVIGSLYTGRALVDGLTLGALGIGNVTVPLPLALTALVFLLAAALWWWRVAPARRLLLLGLGCILSSYLLIYSARAEWSYEQMVSWSRYHLFAQLGLALFICGGLPRWQGSTWHLDPAGKLSPRQVRGLVLLIGVLFVTQLPRGVIGAAWWSQPDQRAVLRQIDDMDARCHQYHIDRETALEALGCPGAKPGDPGWLDVPGAAGRENGWNFLRGSSDPRPISVAEARERLTGG